MQKLVTTTVVLLAMVTLAHAEWEELAPAPEEYSGSAITWGDGQVWGLFTEPNEGEGYIYSYSPGNNSWTQGDDYLTYELQNTAVTFQTVERPVLWVIGAGDEDPYLWSYDANEGVLEEEDLPFTPGAGASLAFVPNVSEFGPVFPIPGWLYCFSGNGTGFWRVPVPTTETNGIADGICPAESAVIANRAPFFLWPRTATATMYRLKVSVFSSFMLCAINDSTTDTTLTATVKLTDGMKYWRVDRKIGGNWTTGATHVFSMDADWHQMTNAPQSVGAGAALAYNNSGATGQRIYALFGGDAAYFRSYSVAGNSWSSETQSDLGQCVGSALACGPDDPHIFAEFGAQGATPQSHWWFNRGSGTWTESRDNLPEAYVGPGASLAYSPDDNYLYLIPGEYQGIARDGFYRDIANDDDRSLSPETQGRASAGRHAGAVVRAGHNGAMVSCMTSTPGRVDVTIFDAMGRDVTRLTDNRDTPGRHELEWQYSDAHGRRVAPGAYFAVVMADGKRTSLKVVVH